MAILKNHGNFKVAVGSKLEFSDGSVLNNQHLLSVLGKFNLQGHSVCENAWGFKIESSGAMQILERARLLNRGNIYIEGKLKLEAKDSLINKNLVYDRNKHKLVNFDDFLIK